ncbi:trehalose utilization protein ThuA [Kribbella pittospori]|uniref:Trehalose utilization protein ThuA n=1 Tax=Kribbella pittospori TaxID=722689 RepID=A0A4R0JWP3_9ACTN|nr:ThuA domain-containing protein [Kribbella pittospori]TCC51479.1 trehalose utilization protein ThuA [Kribbella pittospori]
MTRVTVWNEYVHEQLDEQVKRHYPDGIHSTVAQAVTRLLGDGVEVRTATLDQPQHGLTSDVLDTTDVLVWWGHIRHADVADEVVDLVQEHVLGGMGLVALHSSHYSKIFRRLMGTTCSLMFRNLEAGERETVWTIAPDHPIAHNVPHPIVVDAQEMYGEFFDIPVPDELVFVSSFAGGEVFRSGCTFRRGKGRIFYFSPGDQAFPVYHNPHIQQVIANAVRWAAPAETQERVRWDRRRKDEINWFTNNDQQGVHA